MYFLYIFSLFSCTLAFSSLFSFFSSSSGIPPHTAQTFKCYCNQFNTIGCVRKNSTWGECSATAGEQLCIAAWERSPIDSLIIVEYFCSDVALLRYSCLPNGVQMLGSKQFPIVKVCCESDYCNGPTRLQSFVDALVTGMRYLYLITIIIIAIILLVHACACMVLCFRALIYTCIYACYMYINIT